MMAERNQPEFYQLKTQSFFEAFARRYLVYLGNTKPNKTQLSEMIDLLSHVWLRHLVTMDIRLTDIERQCLYLFSQGKTTIQVADFFSLTERQVERYRENILRELNCNNTVEAVAIGIRYGEIPQKK
jgi:DNA-binding CsgD family transcriptional regulator